MDLQHVSFAGVGSTRGVVNTICLGSQFVCFFFNATTEIRHAHARLAVYERGRLGFIK